MIVRTGTICACGPVMMRCRYRRTYLLFLVLTLGCQYPTPELAEKHGAIQAGQADSPAHRAFKDLASELLSAMTIAQARVPNTEYNHYRQQKLNYYHALWEIVARWFREASIANGNIASEMHSEAVRNLTMSIVGYEGIDPWFSFLKASINSQLEINASPVSLPTYLETQAGTTAEYAPQRLFALLGAVLSPESFRQTFTYLLALTKDCSSALRERQNWESIETVALTVCGMPSGLLASKPELDFASARANDVFVVDSDGNLAQYDDTRNDLFLLTRFTVWVVGNRRVKLSNTELVTLFVQQDSSLNAQPPHGLRLDIAEEASAAEYGDLILPPGKHSLLARVTFPTNTSTLLTDFQVHLPMYVYDEQVIDSHGSIIRLRIQHPSLTQ